MSNPFQQYQERMQKIRSGRSSKQAPQSGKYTPSARGLRMRIWKPEERPMWIRVIPQANGNLFYTYYANWVPGKYGQRFVINNSHNGRRACPDSPTGTLPCNLDYWLQREEAPNPSAEWLDTFGRKQRGAWTEYRSMTVVLLDWFWKVPVPGKAYFSYERCGAPNKYGKVVDNHSDQGYEKIFGMQRHWSVKVSEFGGEKRGHWGQLNELLDQVTQRCQCGDGHISVWGYSCSAPGENGKPCGWILGSHKEEVIPEEVEDMFKTEEVSCPGCDAMMRPTPLVECGVYSQETDTWQPIECADPQPTELTGVDIKLSMLGKGVDSRMKLHGVRPTVESEDIKDYALQPFAFDDFFGYQLPSDQAETLGFPCPFAEEGVDADALVKAYFESPPSEADEESIPY